MLRIIENLYNRIRFGKCETIDDLRKRLNKVGVPLNTTGLETILDERASTDFRAGIVKNNPLSENPYASPRESVEIPVNCLFSYFRGVELNESSSGEVEITGEYFRDNLADNKVDGQWKPRVLYHERVKITVRKIPAIGTLYSARMPKNTSRRFILDLPPEEN